MADNDDRTYIKVHDGISDHPKVDGLSDRAFRLLVDTWCWCSRHLTDGYVPQATWEKRATKNTRRELIAAGLVIVRATGGVECHDYLSHQRSASEVAELREKKKLAAAKGNHERWHVGPKGKPSAMCKFCPKDEDVPTEEPPPDQQEEPEQAESFDPNSIARAIASGASPETDTTSGRDRETSPETEEVLRTSQSETDPLPPEGGAGEPADVPPTETKKPGGRKSKQSAAAPPMFDEFWKVWPRKLVKGEARKKFAAAVARGADPAAIVEAARAHAEQWHRDGKEVKYIPHATTWLNQNRYEDPPERSDLRLVSSRQGAWETYDAPESPWAQGWR